MKSFTTLQTQFGVLSKNSTAANLALGSQLINDSLRYLTLKYYLNQQQYIVPGGTVASQQGYQVPFDLKDMINFTITVGSIRYTLKETPSQQYWDKLNLVPIYADIPQFYYRFQNQVQIFPIPANGGNVITFTYKRRIKDLSQPDYTAGTITVTNGSTAVTGLGTTWNPYMAGMWLQATAPNGDNNWYQIASAPSTTGIVLDNQYQGINNSGVSYTIGEMPLLTEDYQDLALYRALSIYFTTIVPDKDRKKEFTDLYDTGIVLMDAELGSKSDSVAIITAGEEISNPNIYLMQGGQSN